MLSREALCCDLDRPLFARKQDTTLSNDKLPDLCSSFDSNSSEEAIHLATKARAKSARFDSARNSTTEGRGKTEKHISSLDLEKIVISIKSRRALVPLSPLPAGLTPSEPALHTVHETLPLEITPQHVSAQTTLPPSEPNHFLDSSTSTVDTEAHSDYSDMSPPLAGSETTGTEASATSIVRGFSRDHISSSARSQSQLLHAPSGSILKTSPANRSQMSIRPKKGATFQLGGSSGENDSSFENSYLSKRSSLSQGLMMKSKKTASFNEEVATRTIPQPSYQNNDVFDESDEEDDEQSGSAIEEDDVDDWEDDDESSSPPSSNDQVMFQRQDSKPNLVSHRSLLTKAMHEKDRATALQNAASRSTPAIRRSRTTSPNGPLGSSPPKTISQGLEMSRSRPIIMTTSNVHPPALSPRTTRRNMLSTELTESLRRNLLWDRQVNRSTTNAALKRRHTAQDMTKIQQFPGENVPQTYMAPQIPISVNGSLNNYYDVGLQEYHQKGW